MKMWLTVGVKTSLEWPRKDVVAHYGGRTIVLLPGGEKLVDGLYAAPTVGVAYEAYGAYMPPHLEDARGEPRCADLDEASRVIKRFLSMLAWSTGDGIIEHGGQGGSLTNAVTKQSVWPSQSANIFDYYLDCLSEPATEEGRFALAFYREGLSIESPSYRFLSFAKVLNLKLLGTEQIAWINESLEDITEPLAAFRIETLRQGGENVGEYLYTSGRCAVAHALGEPRVDPDDPADLLRLHHDLPLIQALADLFISRELGVKSPYDIADERWHARVTIEEQE